MPRISADGLSALLLHIWAVADGAKSSVCWLHTTVDWSCAWPGSSSPSSQLDTSNKLLSSSILRVIIIIIIIIHHHHHHHHHHTGLFCSWRNATHDGRKDKSTYRLIHVFKQKYTHIILRETSVFKECVFCNDGVENTSQTYCKTSSLNVKAYSKAILLLLLI